MRIATILGLMIAGLAAAVPPALAGSNPDLELAIVPAPHEPRSCGGSYASCADMEYRYDGTGSYDLIVVAYNYTGLTGLSYAINYSEIEGAEFGAFRSCAPLFFEEEQSPGFYALSQSWTACQVPASGEGMVVGWMELWGGMGRVEIAPNRDVGGIFASDCEYQPDVIVLTHPALVGGALPRSGDTTPCGAPITPLAVEEETWGGVKSLYR